MKNKSKIDSLIEAIVDGEAQRSVTIAEELMGEGLSVENLIQDGLTAALRSLNAKCTNEDFNLLEIMLAGRAMMAVMDNVVSKYLPVVEVESVDPSKIIVIGTIEGDIHELGKHVVKMLLRSSGFKVIDLGKDVRPEEFVSRAIKENAGYIGVSSLLTPTVPSIRKIREILRRMGREDIKIIAGGGAIQQACTEDLDVDFVAKTAFDIFSFLDVNGCKRDDIS